MQVWCTNTVLNVTHDIICLTVNVSTPKSRPAPAAHAERRPEVRQVQDADGAPEAAEENSMIFMKSP